MNGTAVVGVVMMVSTGYILLFLRFCVVPLLSYNLLVGWLSDMDFLTLLSTRMRSAICEYAPHYIKFYIYLPVLSKRWHEIVTAVRIMPWRRLLAGTLEADL